MKPTRFGLGQVSEDTLTTLKAAAIAAQDKATTFKSAVIDKRGYYSMYTWLKSDYAQKLREAQHEYALLSDAARAATAAYNRAVESSLPNILKARDAAIIAVNAQKLYWTWERTAYDADVANRIFAEKKAADSNLKTAVGDIAVGLAKVRWYKATADMAAYKGAEGDAARAEIATEKAKRDNAAITQTIAPNISTPVLPSLPPTVSNITVQSATPNVTPNPTIIPPAVLPTLDFSTTPVQPVVKETGTWLTYGLIGLAAIFLLPKILKGR